MLAAIGEHGAHIGEIETIAITRAFNIRDVTVIAPGDQAVDAIRTAVSALDGVELVSQSIDKVFAVHEGGKIATRPTVEVRNLLDVRAVYTPGVARVTEAIARDPGLADRYTWRGRTIAVVSDGSRVLGLGDVGPVAALPVMEGKALFYSLLVDLNAVPIVVDVHDPEGIAETIARIAPGFGGIHLEDIASPGVYEVERSLMERLDMPVLHDDQHATAVVVLAAVLSAAAVLGRNPADLAFGQVGLGAAGSAIAHLARSFGFSQVLAYDPDPAATTRLEEISAGEQSPLESRSDPGGLKAVLEGADVVVFTTGKAGLVTRDSIRAGQVIMALTNPVPEISTEEALAGGAAIATDGSLVNNVLAYPGLFKGALDAGATRITMAMKRAAAEALSSMATVDALLPDSLDRRVHALVAERVAAAAGDR